MVSTNPKKFYDGPRVYITNYPKKLDIDAYDKFFEVNKGKVNRLIQDKYTYFDISVDNVINNLSKKKFVVI